MPIASSVRARLVDHFVLLKPRLTTMVVFTAFVGYAMGRRGPLLSWRMAAALAGTALVAASAAALNQVLERRTDALMERTRERPLAAGRIAPLEAGLAGTAIACAGILLLLTYCGPLAAAVALATWACYLFVYTPLKRRTPLATLVGAVPGALPPVIGWTAAAESVGLGAFVLFAILFLWQVPHFLAIAWLFRDDYARAGFPMLPVVDVEGRFTARQTVLHALALLLVSLAPGVVGGAGPLYLAGALLLGVGLTAFAVRLLATRARREARQLFLASLVYLPALSSLLLGTRP